MALVQRMQSYPTKFREELFLFAGLRAADAAPLDNLFDQSKNGTKKRRITFFVPYETTL